MDENTNRENGGGKQHARQRKTLTVTVDTEKLLRALSEALGEQAANVLPELIADGEETMEQLQQQLEALTVTANRSTFSMPQAKVWQRQQDIARNGAQGMPVNVGGNSKATQVYINAQISDANGNPIELTQAMKDVQRAVGNLIDDNGGVAALPIFVTAAQVYRAAAGLKPDALVTPEQQRETESALDRLMDYPCVVNFKAQLEKHTNMQQQPDYDYTAEDAGKLKGHLVIASKVEGGVAYRGRDLPVVYKVYEYPTLYRYSHLIGQMERVEKRLLAGAAISLPDGTSNQRRTLDYTAVRSYILQEVIAMKRQRARRKSFNNQIKVADVVEACKLNVSPRTRRTLIKNMGLYLTELKQAGEISQATMIVADRGRIDGYEVTL